MRAPGYRDQPHQLSVKQSKPWGRDARENSMELLLHFTASRLRATDLIVKNLIVANFLVLFSSGLCYPLELFAWFHIFNDFGCRFFLYVRQVGRDVSMGTTCLLSVVQAITISPQGSSTLSDKNISDSKCFRHCSVVRFDQITDSLFAALLSLPDVVFFVIMLWASGSMVCTLHRHRQQVRHLHRSSASSTSSPESRATRTILLLLFLYFTVSKLRATDLIVKNLVVANFLVLISSGICYPLASLGEHLILNDVGCRFCHYARQVGRGVSISTTCLLSVVQAVTISPQGSSSSLSSTNASNRKMFGQCDSVRHDKASDSLFAALYLSTDVLCVGLMLWASGSMVCTLHRHRQRVRHLHRSSASSTSSPESRATRTILLLVSTFVCFYTLSSTCQVCLSLLHSPDMILVRTCSVVAACFPTLSPFVLMSRDLGLPRLCSRCTRNLQNLPPRGDR
ncbi:Vomeronasal type-1 receptor 4 [Galemys pyrenaicus]|uniref:Vomeronasal type-1 receptor 4 n=1 Tax=Galemys pyrenaicus TaxID=202257 RepID=A0A8J6DKA0_GALPY|nr:Vomeronasal type-1 receptor 4 [Galemys pyrenaicus]